MNLSCSTSKDSGAKLFAHITNDIETVKKEYDNIKNNYSGNAKEYINKINMIEKNHEIQLLQKDNDNQLLQKENEILHLKLLLASK